MITRFQKFLIGGSLALAAGTAIHGVRQASLTRSELRSLNEEARQLDTQIQRLVRARKDSAEQLAKQEEQNERLSRHQTDLLKQREEAAQSPLPAENQANTDSETQTWPARVSQLKQCFELNPAARIPEIKLLDEADWLTVAKDFPMQTENDYRLAMSAIRSNGEHKFMGRISQALHDFQQAEGGKTPSTLSALEPYFNPPADPAILARWKSVPGEAVGSFAIGSDFVITQMLAVVDPEVDNVKFISARGTSMGSYDALQTELVLSPVRRAYLKAHQLKKVPDGLDPKDLRPFAVTSEQQTMLERVLRIRAASEGR